MSYRCTVCGETTGTSRGMCEHITGSSYRPEEHKKWLQDRGIDPAQAACGDTSGPLIQAIERECQRYEPNRRG